MQGRVAEQHAVEDLKPLHTANAVYYPALDGFRGCALILVFLDHYGGVPILGLGVSLFFVLSGFLITGILWDTRSQPHRLRNFYVRRTLRIFPLYYGVFLVILLLAPLLRWQWNSGWWMWVAYLGNFIFYLPRWLPQQVWNLTGNGMLHGRFGMVLFLGHLWSLCLEEQFYLIWPWIAFRATRKALLWICIVSCVVLPGLRVWADHTLPRSLIDHGLLMHSLPFQVDSLLLGAWLALLLRGEMRDALLRAGRWAGDAAAIAAMLYLVCCVNLHLPGVHPLFLLPLPWLSWQFTLVNLLGAALILGSLQPASGVYRVFDLRPLRRLGRISYGAYVFHDILHVEYVRLAFRISPRHWIGLAFVMAAVMTIGLATLSFRYFERPFLRLKDRWTIASTA